MCFKKRKNVLFGKLGEGWVGGLTSKLGDPFEPFGDQIRRVRKLRKARSVEGPDPKDSKGSNDSGT